MDQPLRLFERIRMDLLTSAAGILCCAVAVGREFASMLTCADRTQSRSAPPCVCGRSVLAIVVYTWCVWPPVGIRLHRSPYRWPPLRGSAYELRRLEACTV